MSSKKKRIMSGVVGVGTAISAVTAQASVNYTLKQEQVSEEQIISEISTVDGHFAFSQDVITPAEDMFNLFGTVISGMCAKPAFTTENSEEIHYINVGGHVKKSYTVKLNDMLDKRQSKMMLCSCATGPASANVEVTGVPLKDILEIAETLDGANTVVVKGADGYGNAIPLSYALEREAMVVYKVNGQKLPSGTQLWMPRTVAKYFTRDVVDIELKHLDELPVMEERNEEYRAEIAIMNDANSCDFYVDQKIVFEGYADDFGEDISAIGVHIIF